MNGLKTILVEYFNKQPYVSLSEVQRVIREYDKEIERLKVANDTYNELEMYDWDMHNGDEYE